MLTSKYFEIQELVSPEIYEILEDDAWKVIDPQLIETIDKVREILNVPLICNNWHWGGSRKNSGMRAKTYPYGAPKSYHKRGQAVDLISHKMSAKEMREIIEERQDELPYPIRIEKWDNKGELTWVHIDMGNTKGNKIYFFRA